MTATTLKPQAMNATKRLASKIININRDATAASGDVSYTGVGFMPTAMVITYGISSTYNFGMGMVDSAKTVNTSSNDATAFNIRHNPGYLVTAYPSGGSQFAILKTWDADGFTLTWTKSGSPTGTIALFCLCFQ